MLLSGTNHREITIGVGGKLQKKEKPCLSKTVLNRLQKYARKSELHNLLRQLFHSETIGLFTKC
jgi:hypothetical protein